MEYFRNIYLCTQNVVDLTQIVSDYAEMFIKVIIKGNGRHFGSNYQKKEPWSLSQTRDKVDPGQISDKRETSGGSS